MKNFTDFADALCHLNTAIIKYERAEKARNVCQRGHLPIAPEVIDTILDVLNERIVQCEREIIEWATKLTTQQEEKPTKKKK